MRLALVVAAILYRYWDPGLVQPEDLARFRAAYLDPDTGRFTATFEKMRRGFARVQVTAHVGDELAAEGTILAIFQSVPKASPSGGPQPADKAKAP